jgi:hypothetical protein
LNINVPRRGPTSFKYGLKFCLWVAVTLFVLANKTTILAPCLIVNEAWSAIALDWLTHSSSMCVCARARSSLVTFPVTTPH